MVDSESYQRGGGEKIGQGRWRRDDDGRQRRRGKRMRLGEK